MSHLLTTYSPYLLAIVSKKNGSTRQTHKKRKQNNFAIKKN